jgi:hypothetical protein
MASVCDRSALMTIKRSRAELFGYLGAPLNNVQWSWGAVRETDGSVFLVVWQDENLRRGPRFAGPRNFSPALRFSLALISEVLCEAILVSRQLPRGSEATGPCEAPTSFESPPAAQH